MHQRSYSIKSTAILQNLCRKQQAKFAGNLVFAMNTTLRKTAAKGGDQYSNIANVPSQAKLRMKI